MTKGRFVNRTIVETTSKSSNPTTPMKTFKLLALFGAILLGVSPTHLFAEAPPERSDKAKSIFDGKTLDGWEAPPPVLWAVKNECITGGDGIKVPYNDFLCTKASYSNFILHLKIKLTGDPKTGFINSGVQIRTHRNPTGHEVCGYQCDYGEPSWYAAIYDEGRRDRLMMPSDMAALRPAIHQWDWNDYVIKADGGRIKTWINGVQGVDYVEKDPDIASDGIIGIQIHGGGNSIVQVKDIFIEELPPTPNAITWEKLGGVEGQRARLKRSLNEVLKPKFNKRSGDIDPTPKVLNDWDVKLKLWHFEEGAVSAEIYPDQALALNEYLFWKGEVQDFELTFEYRITGEAGLKSSILFRSQPLNSGTPVGYQAMLDDGAKNPGGFVEEGGRAQLAERGKRVSISPDGRRWVDTIAEQGTYQSVVRSSDWNACRVRATASHLELWINGVLFSALDDHQANVARFGGQLGIQVSSTKGPGKIEFRKMQLADLGGTEPPVYQVKLLPAQQLDVVSIKPLGVKGKPINLDFETGTLEGWKIEGDAWEGQPVKGDTVTLRNRGKSNHAGQFWIGGYEKIGDRGTGRLTSSSFDVTHPWASFMIGGGKNPE